MNVRTILLWGILAVLTLLLSCQNPTGPETQVTAIPTSVRGMVMRSDNLAPITNAIIYDVGGLARDTSKSDGTFRLVYQLLSQTKTRIIGSRSGFGNDTASVTLNPGVDTTITLRLKADSSSPSGAVSSGKAANIVLIASSSDNISIRGTGSNETALLEFEVRDSLGIPIAGVNKLNVNFSILGGPGGGEYIFPVSAETDPLTGRVSTRVSSGTKSGVLQVYATATVPVTPPLTIKSSPIRITISGGLPDDAHFSISRKPLNIAGGVYDNLRAQVMVIVGDKEGNPVQQGTAVSFTTTGGVIQPNALTDKDGIAQVELISSNPRPSNSVAIVTAKTIGDSGKSIQKSTVVLFSGPTRILAPSSTIVIPDSGVASFQYRVQDPNGFPLAGGTSIALTVDGPGSGQLELSGDVNKTFEDTNDPNSTLLQATVRDKQLHGPAGAVSFKISVTSQNGNSSATFPGLVLSDTSVVIPPSKSGYVSSLSLVGIDNQQVSVSGTGANEVAKLTFVAKDSLGNPIELRKRAYVTFALSPTGGVGGGEFLFPAADSTDAFGQVTTSFNAGTRSGVLQVIARSSASGRVITASPIRITIAGGLPDSLHFTASLSNLNMPGLIKAGALGTVGVQVGDKFGNAVQPGTALAFSISGGLIQANSATDNAGQSAATIYGGNPAPNEPTLGGPGHGYITIQTVGEGGVAIRKRVPFLFSGASRVIAPSTLISIPDSGVAVFQYGVQDINGNPLVAGTSVNLTVDGPGSSDLELSGDVNKILLDSDDPATTLMTATVRDKILKGVSGNVTFKVTVTSPNGGAVATFPGVVLKDTSSVPPILSPTTPVTSGYASSLTVVTVGSPQVSVIGTGANETSRLVFVAKDSVGTPVDIRRRAYVTFSVLPTGGLGGGEFLSPTADSTSVTGEVVTTFNAGTKSGVVQVQAHAVVNGRVIVSAPVRITIASGLPDQAHFTAQIIRNAVPVFNLPGWYNTPGAELGRVNVQVGDKFGNPVQPGTAVYFTTTGGVVEASLSTNVDGQAISVDAQRGAKLWGGNPFPNDGGVAGAGHVTVSTVGEGGVSVQTTVPFIFSGTPIVTFPTFGAGSLPAIADGGFLSVDYTVQDLNGNPIAPGNNIQASLSGTAASQLGLSLDSRVNTTDTRLPSDQHYVVRLTDPTQGAGTGGTFTLTITVTSPTGFLLGTKSINGFLQAPGVIGTGGGGTGRAKSILLRSASATDISVKGTGSSETATLIFEAHDSLGAPIDAAHSTLVTFSISAPDLGATLTIPSVATDGSGRATTLVQSGTTAGVIQVRASTIIDGQAVSSLPVRLSINSGLPDQLHFTIGAQRFNFPGLRYNGLTDDITVQMGDRYSNPVQPGTVAYFKTSHGIVQTTGSTTSGDGFITKALYSANPRPEGANVIPAEGPGWSYVVSTTAGPNGTTVKDSVRILWTGPPIITLISGPPDPFDIAKGGGTGTWIFTVEDLYGHPMSAGTTITVSALNGIVGGDAAVGLPDVTSGFTTFAVDLANAEKAGGLNPSVTSKLIVRVNHPVYGEYSLVIASGIMR